MKIISLFDGMSVAQQSLKELNIQVEKYYASEIDPYAIAITQANHPNTIQVGSVVDLVGLENENIELLIGGSPCQDLSIAKKGREGLKGARSSLFYEYVRILREVQPKYFILENVASMPKDAKDEISKELDGIEPVMINAALVSAQNRKRYFWVGSLQKDGTYKQVQIPQPEDKGILLKDILEDFVDEKYYVKNERKNTLISNRPQDMHKNKANTLLVGGTNPTIRVGGTNSLIFLGGIRNKDWAKDGKNYSRNFGQGDRVYSPEGKSATLSANGGGRGAKTGLYAVGAASRTYPRTKVEGVERHKQIELRNDEKANCMTSVQEDSMVMQNTQIRKLTPIECLRLQSMPDNYFDKAIYKNKPISDSQRYKMCGNAFNCEVIKHIIKNLK